MVGSVVALETVEAVAVSMPSPDYERESQCEVSESFVDSILTPVLEELDLTDYVFSNVTNTRCYSYSDSSNVYVNVDLKKSEDDYKVKRFK